MQKPSDGAVKAAEEIAELIRGMGFSTLNVVDVEDITTIIDIETRDQWILCSDRMPTEEDGDERGQVLAYNYIGAMKVVIPWNSIMAKETLWQPLPTPPEEL